MNAKRLALNPNPQWNAITTDSQYSSVFFECIGFIYNNCTRISVAGQGALTLISYML